ncbi:MAG: outer membrane protein assembly factor BamB family protein [Promethearchaeota archaeon]|jgi:WD40 repeat protein
MKLQKNKIITTIALLLILTITVLTVNIPSANAFDTEWNTYAYVMVAPNPVGVGQAVHVTGQIDKVSPLAVGVAEGTLFTGLTVEITKPDGTKETKGPFTLYTMSNAFFSYTPTQAGIYKFQTFFPGQWTNGSYRSISGFGSWSGVGSGIIFENRYYKPSQSNILELTVQEEPVERMPDIPLPVESWTRPISAEHKGWYQVADNWLMPSYDNTRRAFSTTAFAPYTSAPDSPHILWTREITYGGMVGGPYGDYSYYSGLSYEANYFPPIIIGGRIFYQEHGPSADGTNDIYGTRCISLYTGEELYYLKDVVIDFGQVLAWDSPNEHGAHAFLWDTRGSVWKAYDAFTGVYVFTIENVTSGTTVFGPSGELLSYRLSASANTLTLWNSTHAIMKSGAGRYNPPRDFEYWSPARGRVVDGRYGLQWNVTIPDIPGSQSIGRGMVNYEEGYIVATARDQMQYPILHTDVAYSTKTGQQLWVKERTNIMGHRESLSSAIQDGVFARWDQATKQIHGYDVTTGNEIWTTDPLPTDWGIFSAGHQPAYGRLYTAGYDGYVRAYDLQTGVLDWEWFTGNAGLETPYGHLPTYGMTIADGKVFVHNDEHSPDSIQWRGARLWCLDAESGEELWSIDGRHVYSTISDGILTDINIYDMRAYGFGKGPSKTTVEAPKVEITQGQKIVIEGTVTDQTPASKDTPAISDEDMRDWMTYLHMNKAIPSGATGVEVVLDVIDANGNYRNIGTATSDISGVYSLVWQPDIPGKYTIIATFAGSNSYDSSFAETSVYVEQASATAPSPTPSPAPMTDTYLAGSTIAILAGIAVAVRRK